MVKVNIFPHSIVGIITNSSSELFCTIESKEFIKEIKEILENILKRKLNIYSEDILNAKDIEDNAPSIGFDIEYGEDQDEITNDFCNLLEEVLNNKIGKGNFIIRRDVSY